MKQVRAPEPSYVSCLASIGLGSAPLFLVFGLAAIFGADTVIFNGRRVHGWIALFDAVVLNIVYAFIFAVLQKFGFLLLNLIERRRARA